jgi:hypothetical protein
MASASDDSGGLVGFLRDALVPLSARPLLAPLLLLTVLLTASNIVILLNVPVKGQTPPAAFLAAAFVRVAGLLVVAVAILRRLTASPRPAWLPDAGFWLYVLSFLFIVGLTAMFDFAAGNRPDTVIGVLVNALASLVTAPLAVWFTAMAVARPLAWRPSPWLRAWWSWLPHYLVWTLLLIVPLGALHAAIDGRLVSGAGAWFWPLALVDGPLSLLVAAGGLALAAEAYRRVARS